MKKYLFPIAVLAATSMIIGCGEKTPKLVQIDGTVLLDGEPCPDVKVTFMPDPEEGNFGRSSVGETDANGKFTLQYMSEKKWKDGVALGWHKVAVRDLIPTKVRDADDDEERGGGVVEQRFDVKYGASTTTPIKFEVTGADQTVKLEIEGVN